MKIRTFYILSGDVYRVSVYTQDWSEGDTDLMVKYGEPQIDLGGDFTNPAFTLPTVLRNIKSESPFAQQFDARDTDAGVAKSRAQRWAADMATRITTAIGTLRGNTDDYSGEEVVTV